MEGILDVWSGFLNLGTWSKRYFVLSENILTICKKKGGDMQAKIHMKVATIDPMDNDQRQFIIHTGINKFYIRTATSENKHKWISLLLFNKESSTERF